jgi:hypothetical protein
MRLLFLPLLFIAFNVSAQCKEYVLGAKRDTLNCVDRNDLKQGRWVVRVGSIRGEPGYEEEGIFKDGKKEGIWRRYNTMGDVLAIERYRWGNKDGISQYFNMQGVIREESWKAVNPANPYDTVDVHDPIDPHKVVMKVVKIEGTSVKHGKWKYYDGGFLSKTENWFLDKIEDPNAAIAATATDTTTTAKPKVKPKPKEVVAFEKKVGKKKVKVIDGSAH